MDINPQQLGIDFGSLGIDFGSGAVIGAIIGFTAKKMAKIIAVIIGIELVLFRLLESRGILQVNWVGMEKYFPNIGEMTITNTPPEWMVSMISSLSIGAGFIGGFLLGFKQG